MTLWCGPRCRRREEADLQKALHLSTQGSHPQSSVFLSSSSPIQIPSGFRLAFQSESTQGSANVQFSDTHGSGSGTGSAGSANPSTFPGFQGGIFAGLQTPVVESDRSTSILSPTMVVTERAVQGAGSSKSHDGSRRYPAPGGALDDDVVAGSEDDETEEEEPYEAMQRSAHTGRSLPVTPLPAAKPMSPLPIPASETIESFPASSSSNHTKPSHPLNRSNVPPNYVSSSIEGFTTSNSDGRKGTSSTDPAREPQRARIVLSAPTEHARSRPQPKQRRKAEEAEAYLFDPEALAASPVGTGAGPSNASNEASGSRSKPVEGSSSTRPATPPQQSTPPRIKPTVVYTKRSVHNKKRKIMLSDSEAEEQEPPVSIVQELAVPVDKPDQASAKPDSKRKNQSDGDDRPSKKNRGQGDARDADTRGAREVSIDPLDLGHVDPDRTPLKSRMVVEIAGAKRSGKDVQPEQDDDDSEVIVVSTSSTKAKAKSKRRVKDDDDEDDFSEGDPFQGLAPDAAMAESDEEDDFVPPGRKRKPPAKAKKPPVEKVKKPPRGKKGKASTPAEATPATVSTVDEHTEAEATSMQVDAAGTASTVSAQVEPPEAMETAKIGKCSKGKAVPATKSGSGSAKSASTESNRQQKSAEFISSDEEEDKVVPTTEKVAAKSTAGSEKAVAEKTDVKLKSKGKAVVSDVEKDEEPVETVDVEANSGKSTAADSTDSRLAAPVLQPTSVSQLNVVKDETVKSKSPNFVVGKDGKIVEFRTTRDDLPKVVSNTGGVKRMGMSRSFRIPSLHRNLKTPPKRLAAPPKKPERKKKSDDEYSDEEPLDEFGRPKPKPGSKEWYMMED